MNRKVFISYSSVDKKYAEQVVKLLEEMKIEFFLDRKDISWGDDVTDEITKAVSGCTDLIVVISPASLESQWVPFEIGHASGSGKKILPLLTHPSLKLPSYLQKYHYITQIEDARSYFTSSVATVVSLQNANTATGNNEHEEFDRTEAAKQIMSAVVTRYCQLIREADTEVDKTQKRTDLAEMMRQYGDDNKMTDEVYGVWIDQCISKEMFLTTADFATNLQDVELINSLPTPVGQKLVDWLVKIAFEDPENGDTPEKPV